MTQTQLTKPNEGAVVHAFQQYSNCSRTRGGRGYEKKIKNKNKKSALTMWRLCSTRGWVFCGWSGSAACCSPSRVRRRDCSCLREVGRQGSRWELVKLGNGKAPLNCGQMREWAWIKLPGHYRSGQSRWCHWPWSPWFEQNPRPSCFSRSSSNPRMRR